MTTASFFTLNSSKRNAIKSIAACALFTGATGLLVACSPEEKPQFKSIDLTGADYATGFTLADQNGQQRSMKNFAGKVVIVFFGFTQCPDVCPTSMVELAQIKKAMGTDGDKLQVVFITVDPERDTPELLKAYMGNFDPTFIALRPTIDQLPQVAKDFKIYYKKVEGKTPGSYSMDHTAGSYVYDPKGNIRLYSRYGNDAQGLTSDFRVLLKGGVEGDSSTPTPTYTPMPAPTVDNSKKKAACTSESMEGYGTGVIAGQKMSKSDEDYATQLIYKQCMSR